MEEGQKELQMKTMSRPPKEEVPRSEYSRSPENKLGRKPRESGLSNADSSFTLEVFLLLYF